MMHDAGCDFKVPLPMFSERKEDWPMWSARFGAYTEVAGWSTVLEVAQAQTAPSSTGGAAPEPMRVGKVVHAVLLTKTEGPPFSIVHLTSRGAGAEAWTLMHADLERGLEPWYETWCARENSGWRMPVLTRTS